MKIKQYQVDAFATRVFEGNPAAVCPLDGWLDDSVLQAIAEENNLSETAFFVATARGFRLRWFTPVAEVDLCGHATLAAAHVLFEILGHPERTVTFDTRSGDLIVERAGGRLAMDFPAIPPQPCVAPDALIAGLGRRPLEVLAADDYVAVFDSEAAVRNLSPDYARLRELDRRGVIATAPGDAVDFVSRFFAPKFGIPEDPGHGLRALRARAVLVIATCQDRPEREAGFQARWKRSLRTRRRSRHSGRQRGDVHGGGDRRRPAGEVDRDEACGARH